MAASVAGLRPVSRGLVPLAALMVAAGLITSGCGEKRKRVYYDPPAEETAGEWSTFAVGDPARLRVPPPPQPGSPEQQADTSELRRLAAGRDLRQVRDARYWGLEPTVRPWLDATLNHVSLRRTQDSPTAARAYALVSVAMYDAAVAAWYWKYKYDRKPPGGRPLLPRPKDPSFPSEHAAIGEAAARVLAYALPDRSNSQLLKLAREEGRSRAIGGANYPSDVRAGANLGRAVAAAVIRRARSDGSSQRWDGSRPRGAGSWEPPPGSRRAPVAPLAGRWRTWVLGSPSRFRPPQPAGFDSSAFREEARRVMEARDGISSRQKRQAEYWGRSTGTPLMPGTWNQQALARIDKRGLTIPRATRVFALMNVAMADAGVAAWDAKYTYWTPRPENAIRDLRLDRSWRPYIPTPLSPGFVSGNAAYAAAASRVLGYLFPDSAGSFRRKAAQAANAGVYAGVSFPRDASAGRRLGSAVGSLVVARARRDGVPR